MSNLNLIKKEIAKEYLKVSVSDPSKSLLEFFNGLVINIDEKYSYGS